MEKKFIKKHSTSIIYPIIGFILSVFTFTLIFWLFYEYFFEHFYWYNKNLLYKKLKYGEIYPISKKNVFASERIVEYKLNNGYTIWVYPDNKFTLQEYENGFVDYSYIGLFTCSPFMSIKNKSIIKILNRF